MIHPRGDAPIQHTTPAPANALDTHTGVRSGPEDCARMRELGFTASRHIAIYGQRVELVSDPFAEGDCTAVRVVGEKDATIRTVRLPVAILLRLSDRFPKEQTTAEDIPSAA